MNTLQQEWEKYRTLVYEGAPPMQLKELHQTFFTGALSTLTLIIEASSTKGDEEAANEFCRLLAEVTDACEKHLAEGFNGIDQRN